jgi:Ca2+-binding RTX toxin-like protein
VYNTTTGQLFYDADGNGAGASQLIATLQSGATLAATDIAVDNGTAAPPPPPPGPTINGTAGNDSLVGTAASETINGLAGNDTITGNAGNDTMFGGDGNDSFVMSSGGTGSYGNDSMDGGAGVDYLEFNNGVAQSGIVVDLAAGTLAGGGAAGAGSATLVNIENVMGGQFGDRITGNGADNYVYAWLGDDTVNGGAGFDTLYGVDGNDVLNGGAGNDYLIGGAGADTFVFDQAPGTANADRITDFATAADKLQLDHNVMAALGATGNFASGDVRFFAGAGAAAGHDADDRVVYNTSTGQLYYDDDGSGAHAAQLVATLQAGAALAATDISVI